MRTRNRNSRRLVYRLAVAAAGLLLSATPVVAQTVVEEVDGKVEYRSEEGWVSANAGDELGLGTTLSTGFGASAVLRIGDSTLRVDQLTRMSVEELIESSDSVETEVALDVGRVDADVRTSEARQRGRFTVNSPVATAAVRGTEFSFDGVDLQVTKDGPVVLQNQYGRGTTVAPGQQARGSSFEPPRPPRETRESRGRVSTETDSGDTGEGEGDESGLDPGSDYTTVPDVGTVIIEVGL